jgi:hypothetical protein
MATKIQIRRGAGLPPSDLLVGELAYDTQNKRLYVGTGEVGNPYQEIGGIDTLAELGITATAAELNVLDNSDATTSDLNKLAQYADKLQFLANVSTDVITLLNQKAALSHSHGSILPNGTITEAATIENGDRLIISDAGVIKQSTLAFGIAGADRYLKEDGTWSNPSTDLISLINQKAPINSPAFTGTPTMSTNLVIGDADNRVANKKYVDDRVTSIFTGSGNYLEQQEVILINGNTYNYNLFTSFNKLFLTLYLESVNNTWTNTGNFNTQTVPAYPLLDLARITRTETSDTEGTCIGAPQYDNDPGGCAIAGFAFQFDTITYIRNPRIYIGIDGAFLSRISDNLIQFTAPTTITNFIWKLKITGVNF